MAGARHGMWELMAGRWQGNGMGTAWERYGHGVERRGNGMGTAWERNGHGVGTEWARRGHGMGTEWERNWHGMGTEWARHGNGMGTEWTRHAMCESVFSAPYRLESLGSCLTGWPLEPVTILQQH